jgi:hypothetical protein
MEFFRGCGIAAAADATRDSGVPVNICRRTARKAKWRMICDEPVNVLGQVREKTISAKDRERNFSR